HGLSGRTLTNNTYVRIFIKMNIQNNRHKSLHDTLIRYPKFKELHNDIRECQEESQVANEPQCMSLEGVTGVGKSTLIRDYIKEFPRSETTGGIKIPILYVEMPSPVTVKTLAQTMLAYLGDPGWDKGTQPVLDARIIKFIKHCEVKLVVLDDFQHLIDSETEKILAKVSNWLKTLIKKSGVPFLVIGIDGKVEMILQSNDQLSRLFAVREKLSKFEWDASKPETIQSFAKFMVATEKVIGLRLPWCSNGDAELLFRLHYATDGVVANIMNLMRSARRAADTQGTEQLDLNILAAVYDKRLSKHVGRENPFHQPLDASFKVAQPKPKPNGRSNNGKGGKRGSGRKNDPSANDVLRT
ncbi:MAG: TniB family NTP-binding protein, partial [Anaerolineae bacterium]|nr:TniB family NTP-binding protein [Anaerolineae bacterium]